jgi:hypothetical protein
VNKHFPGTSINRCNEEVPVLVGGLTNMIFEYSKADAIPGAMALRTFTDRLITALIALRDEPTRTATGARVIQGFTQVADPALATREFAPRVQIVGALKNREYISRDLGGTKYQLTPLKIAVTAAVYGQGSVEARNADVLWSSKFI